MEPLSQASTPDAQEWLWGLGYRIVFRVQGWTECLVLASGERWLGQGATETEALLHALEQMLPSRAARMALGGCVARPVEAAEDAHEGGLHDVFARGRDSALRLLVSREAESVVASELSNDELQAPVPGAEACPVAGSKREPELAVEPARAPRLSGADALAALAPLEDRIVAERAELGMASPERQRLVVLGWMCRARGLEDDAGHAEEVEARVHEVARQLALLCKQTWPGAVIALQLTAEPPDTARDLPAGWTPVPRNWHEAADAAEAALRQVEEQDAAAGFDDDGWADAAVLAPAPLDPEAELHALRAEVERLTGSLAQPVAKNVGKRLRKLPAAGLGPLTEWAGLLRWLRGHVTDFESWSLVAGRLRWLSREVAKTDEHLREVLDPTQRPSRSWAAVLGRDPEEKRRRRARQALYRRLPELLANPEEGDVRAWVLDGLDLIENGALAKTLRPFREVVRSIDVKAFLPGAENRRARKRLSAIQQEFEGEPGTVEPLPEVEAEIRQALEAPEAPQCEPVDTTGRLLATVRAFTGGQRAVFVGNRADPKLRGTLEQQLGFASIEWCEGGPRRVNAAAERIEAGAYGVVLGATGFQSHMTDGKLYDACRKAGVTYVRVNKGRLMACAVAIAGALQLGRNPNGSAAGGAHVS